MPQDTLPTAAITAYNYCLMEKDGQFQWRWMPPLPPEASDPAISPVFTSKADALTWEDARNPKNRDTISIDGWRLSNEL